MTTILDTAVNVTRRLDALKAAGVKTVIRYVSTNVAGEKCIKAAEAKAIAAAGLRLCLVFEVSGGTRNELNAELGITHGEFARKWLPQIGAPLGAAVYFAVDTDPNSTRMKSSIMPYLRAARTAMGPQYRMGVYGPGNVCAAASDAGVADLTWLANATGWSGYRAYHDSKRWSILQHLPKIIAGIDVDPDEINPARPDIGDFVPFAPANQPSTPEPNSDIYPGTVIVNLVNVREKADGKSKILGTLERDTEVRVYRKIMNGDTAWLDIGNGFVAARFVAVDME